MFQIPVEAWKLLLILDTALEAVEEGVGVSLADSLHTSALDSAQPIRFHPPGGVWKTCTTCRAKQAR